MTDQQPSTLQRLPHWRLHFDQLLCSRLQTNFAWGIFDCCLFAADVVQAVTGVDPAAPYRGYRGARQGMRLLQSAGGVGSFATRALGFPVRMDLARVGDVVMLPAGRRARDALGVVISSTELAVPGGVGLRCAPLWMARHLWAVG